MKPEFQKQFKKARYEAFGGIVSMDTPPALLYVDKNFMRSLGYKSSVLWERKQEYLSAPTEVHFALTNKCPLKCQGCYVEAGEKIKGELNTKECKRVLKILAEMGIFYIAFGGGECFERDDFFELAGYCRKLGMIPNTTTNGYYITKKIAKKCKILGRINVSLDGIGQKYKDTRGVDGFKIADQAIKLLVEAGNRVGINCIISRKNFKDLKEIVRYAEKQKVESILFLRFKPIGRGEKYYYEMRLNHEQNKKISPLLRELQKKTRVRFEIDSSIVPMLCYHQPSLKSLQFFAANGCEAGNVLLAISPNGQYKACSFCLDGGGNIFNLLKEKEWNNSNYLRKFREWVKHAKEPCKSCKYLEYCKGGCHIIAEFLTGDFDSPDPECPFVVGKCWYSQRG